METINGVLNFPNQREVYNILTGVEMSTFSIISKRLIDEFVNLN